MKQKYIAATACVVRLRLRLSRCLPGILSLFVLAWPAQAQEAGAYATWVARDVDGMRGLKGGGAYIGMSVLPGVDLRLDIATAGRSRLNGSATRCTADGSGPCIAEPVERESRLSTAELGVIGWRRPLPGVRFGAGISVARHGVSVTDQGLHTGLRERLLDGRSAWGPAVSLHGRYSPSFSPGAAVFAAAGRAFVTLDGCSEAVAVECGASGSFTLRAGVGYTFGGARGP